MGREYNIRHNVSIGCQTDEIPQHKHIKNTSKTYKYFGFEYVENVFKNYIKVLTTTLIFRVLYKYSKVFQYSHQCSLAYSYDIQLLTKAR